MINATIMTEAMNINLTQTNQSKIFSLDMANPVFGKVYADHMFISDYINGDWQDLRIVPYANLSLSPANTTLHYASTIFEGLKAYRNKSGEVVVFRPQANAARSRLGLWHS